MKITFFKNESHFYPRISYTWENAEGVGSNSKIQKLRKHSVWLFALPLLIFAFFFHSQIARNAWLWIATCLLGLPAHELCHAAFCWISGRKVERICFFPYRKKVFSSAGAYVKPAFGVWNKQQAILCSAFPLILLSIVPALLAVFVSSLRYELLFFALYNISGSCFDIIDILNLFSLPANCIHVTDVSLTVQDASKPVMIHQIFVTPALDKIYHKGFSYFDGRLTEIQQVYDTPQTVVLKQEFVKQFHLEQ